MMFQQMVLVQHTTPALETGSTMSVISQIFSDFLPQKLKLLTSRICTVMSASTTDPGPIVQCYLTFHLGKKNFTDKFIVLQDLQRDLILGLDEQYN